MSDTSEAPPSGPVAVWARIPAQPGRRIELIDKLQAAIDNANTEDDTLIYILHTAENDDDAVYFYELYTSHDAFVAHGTSDRFKEIGASLRDVAGGRPELTILTPLVGKGY